MRLTLLRRGSVIAALAVGLLGLPSAQSAPMPVLAGITTVAAKAPTSIDVRLPKAVSVATPFESSPDLTVAGQGRLTTFVLTGLDTANRAVTIVGGAVGSGAKQRRFLMPVPQFPALGGGTFEVVKTFEDVTVIPAGRYRLYVVPDGGPATITLRLRGLSGQVRVAPSRRALGEVVAADAWPVATSPVRSNAFAGSTARHLPGPGLAVQVLTSRLEGAAAWQLVMCHDDPSAAPVDPLRTTPGCPSGEKHTLVNHRSPEAAADDKLFVQGFAGLPAGEHGVSAVYTSEAVATSLDYVTLWLTY